MGNPWWVSAGLAAFAVWCLAVCIHTAREIFRTRRRRPFRLGQLSPEYMEALRRHEGLQNPEDRAA